MIRFQAKLYRPGGQDQGAPWVFLNLPDEASHRLPSRSMVSVEGSFAGAQFVTTLLPDGNGGHWMKVKESVRESAGLSAGDVVDVEMCPVSKEPEPEVPDEIRQALDDASSKARETWASITALARRDWIFWITSAKKEETRVKRLQVALSKLSAGNRRPCCFDRSGMYDKSLSSPVRDGEE